MSKRTLLFCVGLSAIAIIIISLQVSSYKKQRRQHRYVKLGRALNRISADVLLYASDHSELISPPFKNVLAQLKREGIRMDEYPYRIVANGMDPWGHEIIYSCNDSKVILRSIGSNGRDEGGRGDDVERVMCICGIEK